MLCHWLLVLQCRKRKCGHLQHRSWVMQHWTSSWFKVLTQKEMNLHFPHTHSQGYANKLIFNAKLDRLNHERYLSSVWLQYVKLVHGETQFAEIDVEVHHNVSWHWRCEHFLEDAGKMWRYQHLEYSYRCQPESWRLHTNHQATGGQLRKSHAGRGSQSITGSGQL